MAEAPARDVPVVFEHAFADELSAGDVVVVEVVQELEQERGPIRLDRGLDALEHAGVDTFRVVGRLHQVRSERSDEHGFAHARGAVLAEVPRDLAGAHREPDQRDLLQIERRQQRVEIGRERVVVVADAGLLDRPKPRRS